MQKKVTKVIGFSPPFFHGRGIFQYTFGLMPYRKPIVTVGKSLQLFYYYFITIYIFSGETDRRQAIGETDLRRNCVPTSPVRRKFDQPIQRP